MESKGGIFSINIHEMQTMFSVRLGFETARGDGGGGVKV